MTDPASDLRGTFWRAMGDAAIANAMMLREASIIDAAALDALLPAIATTRDGSPPTLPIAQLGAIGLGRPGEVERLHQGYGVAIPHSPRLRMVRHLVRIRALELAGAGTSTPEPAPDGIRASRPSGPSRFPPRHSSLKTIGTETCESTGWPSRLPGSNGSRRTTHSTAASRRGKPLLWVTVTAPALPSAPTVIVATTRPSSLRRRDADG